MIIINENNHIPDLPPSQAGPQIPGDPRYPPTTTNTANTARIGLQLLDSGDVVDQPHISLSCTTMFCIYWVMSTVSSHHLILLKYCFIFC